MKILERAVMPNGTKIQLEDWSEYNTAEYPDTYGFAIGAYPIAKNTSKNRLIQSRREFRLTILTNRYMNYTNDDIKNDFEALKTGSKKLEDLSEHFWYGKRDMYYLGMDIGNEEY